jgi:hypothetical protein
LEGRVLEQGVRGDAAGAAHYMYLYMRVYTHLLLCDCFAPHV